MKILIDKATVEQALEALEDMHIVDFPLEDLRNWNKAITSIKEALAQTPLPVQEPTAWAIYDKRGGSKSLHWPENHSPDGDATIYDAVPLYR